MIFNNANIIILLGFDERRGRGDRGNANLDPKHEMDIPANREFYKHNDVRPPYTYAALIRYVSTICINMIVQSSLQENIIIAITVRDK